VKYIPAIISFIIIGAHFLRSGDMWLMSVSLLFPFTFLIKKRWPIIVSSIALSIGSLMWLITAMHYILQRIEVGEPYLRLTFIFAGIIALTIFSSLLLKAILKTLPYKNTQEFPKSSSAAFLVTATLLCIAKIKVQFPIIIIDRFIPGSGWIEIFLLCIYAAWLTEKMMDKELFLKYRPRIWTIFSIVFFTQLILGLSGLEKFLMTGTLHFPIPALILAGPIYRGEGFFMPILLGSTILFIGPAWCSFLCYMGSWDLLAARGLKKPLHSPRCSQALRISILVLVVAFALLLRLLGLSTTVASVLALSFGLAGIALMLLWSRKKGLMMHCITYCPIGIITTVLGKISPFRIRIKEGCSGCSACLRVCRYDALEIDNDEPDNDETPGKKVVKNPNISCTLCGDCIKVCKEDVINYKFFKLLPDNARALFIVLIISIHTVFLALARI